MRTTLQEKNPVTTGKIIASRCDKLRGNRFMQHKDLIAINSTYCNKQVDTLTSLLQQIIW